MKQVESRPLLSRIGLGTWSYGGSQWSHGWGDQPEDVSVATLIQALDYGFSVIDTAPAYGLGNAESLVGYTLSCRPEKFRFVATKCGHVWDPHNKKFAVDLEPLSIREQIEGSLRRLRVSAIDLVFIHYPSDSMDENYRGLHELYRLHREGKINRIGLSNFSFDQISKIIRRFPIYAVQSKYSLLDRRVREEILVMCVDQRIKFYAYQCLESGLLTGSFHQSALKSVAPNDWRSRSRAFSVESLRAVVCLHQKIKDIANRLEVSCANVALAWVLADSRVDVALVGIRNVLQLQDLICVHRVELSRLDLAELDEHVDQLTNAGLNPVL